ncbi:MAG TPA: PAS domain S-box protein [Kiritimatiellia bacterium]|nr:PAS domain S-box protein [Kiritimatiellia bacterium]
MPQLDLKTIVVAGLTVEVVCSLVMVALWRQGRRQYAGLGFWALNFAAQTAGLFLILLRGLLPAWLSITAANVLLLGGAWLGLLGLERFVGRRRPQTVHAVVAAAAAALHAYLTYVQPSLALRAALFAAAMLYFFVRCSALMLRGADATLRPCTRAVGVVFALFAGLFAFRIANQFGQLGRPDDYFGLGASEALFHLAIQVLFVLLTYALVLMVNRRLLLDLTLQREKFSKAFHSSPYALLLTRLSDGQILEINDGFTALAGYEDAEALGTTTIDLNLWAQTGDRDAVVAQLAARGRVDGLEFTFRKKSGELLTGLYSAVVIAVGDEPCILSSIADITARKQAEQERERLVAEREKALAEIKVLGGLLPICMSCKKIRDDQGYWNQIETYIRSHSQAEFSHSLCPECAHKLYPEYNPAPQPPTS